MKGRRPVDEGTKRRALELAEEVGPNEAARRLGVPLGTLKWWRHREGRTGPPKGANPETWADKKRVGAAEAWATAQEALARCRELIEEGGDPRKAQSASVVYGVLVDKAEVLQRAVHEAEQREERPASVA